MQPCSLSLLFSGLVRRRIWALDLGAKWMAKIWLGIGANEGPWGSHELYGSCIHWFALEWLSSVSHKARKFMYLFCLLSVSQIQLEWATDIKSLCNKIQLVEARVCSRWCNVGLERCTPNAIGDVYFSYCGGSVGQQCFCETLLHVARTCNEGVHWFDNTYTEVFFFASQALPQFVALFTNQPCTSQL